jgi:guanylate kinase
VKDAGLPIDHTYPLVLSGPSGRGKTTAVRELLRRRRDLVFSVSATTRPPRPAEREGVDYFFVGRADFEQMRRGGELLEWAEVHGELYGTPAENVEKAGAEGAHLVLDIDVQGARSVRTALPDAVTIFLLPPRGAWLSRLRARGSETPSTLLRRFRTAVEELGAAGEFDYVLVNEDLGKTVDRMEAILNAEESRVGRVGNDLRRFVSDLEREMAAALAEAADRVEADKDNTGTGDTR